MLRKLLSFGLIVAVFASSVCFSAWSTVNIRTVELNGKNTLIFNQEIDEIYVNVFMKALIGARMALPLDQTLHILIKSPGGDYEAGKKLMFFMRSVPNADVICKYCASMAGELLITSNMRRLAIGKSQVMMHEMYIPKMTARQATNSYTVQDLVKSSDEFNKALYTIIGITKEDYEKRIIGTEWNVYGKDLLKWHLADEFVKIQCDGYMVKLAPDTCSQ